MQLSREIFRAYDIRGIVDKALTPEIVMHIAQAIGTEAQRNQQTEVIVARDGRNSGPVLVESLIKGLMVSGCHVIDIGIVPTPLLYFATNVLTTQTGVMLTGSHNPKDYNGLKIVIDGNTLTENKIQELYQRVIDRDYMSGEGQYRKQDISETYLSKIASDIKLSKPLKIIVDAGNGVAGVLAPRLYRVLGCDVTELYCDIDGDFPHHHPDPSVIKNIEELRKQVVEGGYDVGLAFDGDGDRLGVITNQGEVIWPDRQLMLYAKDVLSRNAGANIIYDVKCTKHLADEIQKYQGHPMMWKTGHSLIKQKMREENALLAGEMSGHIFFKERWYGFDDALYTGARLLEIISTSDQSVSELFQTFPDSVNTPELKLSVNSDQRKIILEGLRNSEAFKQAKMLTIDGVRVEFEDAWGLIRGSNTTPHLVLRFEADNEQALVRVQSLFKEELLKLDSQLNLPF